MKKSLFILLLSAALCLNGCGAKAEQAAIVSSSQLNYSEQTITAIQKLTSGDTSGFYKMFDDNMKEEMTEQELLSTWNQIATQYGTFQYYLSEIAISRQDGYQIASVPCIFENGTLTFRLTFNNSGAISGFYMTEGEDSSGSPRLGNDTEISFGDENHPISGSLTLPEGAGPFPAVILVQGSGPYDRNEQIGPNVPFLDLADQLAQHGIAVLRYDTRTYLYEQELTKNDNRTVNDEIIDDVVAAVDFLKTRNTIQSEQIFIAGHDMAGYLMPRIADRTPDAAGFIMLAAASRPLEDILLEQTNYVITTEKNLDEAAKAQMMEQIETTVANIKGLTENSTMSPADLYNLPVHYWLDLQAYDPLSEIKKIHKPLLFLQGGRDYQVTTTDFELWKSVLEENTDVHFCYYDNLNHLFMIGTGKSTPAEYQQRGTVSDEVGNDISDFILKH